jgi:hypothetical protein
LYGTPGTVHHNYNGQFGGGGGGAIGGGGGSGSFSGKAGSAGGVRIVWPGSTRTFPSTCVSTP